MDQKLFHNKIQKGVSLIDFYANSSEPCVVQHPVINRLSKRFKGKVSLISINVNDNIDLAMSFGITSIPTVIVFKNGNEFERFVGLQNFEVLSKVLDKASDVKND